MSVWALLLVCVPLSVSTATLERVELTCGQGLHHCELKSGAGECVCDDSGVSVRALDLLLVRCWTQKRWSLCLNVLLNVSVTDEGSAEEDEWREEEEQREEEQGCVHEGGDMTNACICLRYSDTYPHTLTHTVSFTVQHNRTLESWISLELEVVEKMLGNLAVVLSSSKDIIKQISLPSREEVCSRTSDVVFCAGRDAPRLDWRRDDVSGGVVLFVADAEKWRSQEFSVCQKLEPSGRCLEVEWNNPSHEFVISHGSVAPCLCFKISGNFTSTQYCPFLNQTAVRGSSVSVSLSEAQTRQHLPALLWSITAPCRLEARLVLCMKDSIDGCDALINTPSVQTRHNSSWIQTHSTHWRLQGEFLHVARHPSLCVQVEVSGLAGTLDPVCPFEVRRKHWSFPLMLCVLLVCVTVLGVYAVQGTLKSWVFRWLKLTDVNPACVAGGVPLLLLSPPESSVCPLLLSLSSSLSALGFSVCVDVRSGSALASVGPVPWLHAGLERVRRCGGRAVLVLSRAGLERAQAWGCGGAQEEQQALVPSALSSELFDACLRLILSDSLLDRPQRFLLVLQEERRPALPQLLQGLPLFLLPAQSLGLLTELTRGAPQRWGQARALRAAARVLSAALEDTPAGQRTSV